MGTWVQAILTPAGVFLAARLNQKARVDEVEEKAKTRLIAISRIFRESITVFREIRGLAVAGALNFKKQPPSPARLEDLIGVLDAAPLFEMTEYDVVKDILSVKRDIRTAIELGEAYGTPQWRAADIEAQMDMAIKVAEAAHERSAQMVAASTRHRSYGRRIADGVLGRAA